ncbi:MAG: DUF3267 domain-containing protein [Bacteroidia bacterium]|jgi:hypothetical protein
MIDLEKYSEEKLTINLLWANAVGFLFIVPILLVFGLPYYLLWNHTIDWDNIRILDGLLPESIENRRLAAVVLVLIGIAIHELIHGITWAQFATKGMQSMKFGVLWRKLTPYCHCKEPLKVRHYIVGALMPAVILGFIPALAGIITGLMGLLSFGMFFTLTSVGDFLIIYTLRREKADDYVQDHPSEAGCYVYRANNN